MALFDLSKLSQYARTSIRQKTNPDTAVSAVARAPVAYSFSALTWNALDLNAYSVGAGTVPAGFTLSVDGVLTYTGRRVRRPILRAGVVASAVSATFVLQFGIVFNGVPVPETAQVATVSSAWDAAVNLQWPIRFLRANDTLQLGAYYDQGPNKDFNAGNIVMQISLR